MCDCEWELNNLNAADDIMPEVITRLNLMSFKLVYEPRPNNFFELQYSFVVWECDRIHHNNGKILQCQL